MGDFFSLETGVIGALKGREIAKGEIFKFLSLDEVTIMTNDRGLRINEGQKINNFFLS